MHEAVGWIGSIEYPGVVVQAKEAGGSEVEDESLVCGGFKASVGCIRFCLKSSKTFFKKIIPSF